MVNAISGVQWIYTIGYHLIILEGYGKLLKKNQSSIYNAILKHGHSNFELTIIEYCSPEQCIEREDFYLSSLKHEYNILPKLGLQ